MRDSVTDQNRIIGRLEAQIASAEERLERIEGKVDEMIKYIAGHKGGVRVIWGIAAAGGLIGVSLEKLGSMLVAALKGHP